MSCGVMEMQSTDKLPHKILNTPYMYSLRWKNMWYFMDSVSFKS